MYFIDNELIFNGNFIFQITNKKNFYQSFQIPKSYRKKLISINIGLEKNFENNQIKIKEIEFNNKVLSSDELKEIIADFNNNDQFEITNWIDLKNFINIIFKNHSG